MAADKKASSSIPRFCSLTIIFSPFTRKFYPNYLSLNPKLLKTIRQVLSQNPSVVFAYLYGSAADDGAYNDIDIAVYSATDCDPYRDEFFCSIVISRLNKIKLPPECPPCLERSGW